MSNLENKELIRRAALGDVAAFEELVARHKQALYAYVLGMTGGDHAAAADILQETLLKAFLNIARFRGDCAFITWLWRIARNEFADYRRSPKTAENAPLDSAPHHLLAKDHSFEEEITKHQRREALYALLAMLTPEHREVIVLVDIQEMRYDEAAALTGISESALKSRLFRARENLLEIAMANRKLFR